MGPRGRSQPAAGRVHVPGEAPAGIDGAAPARPYGVRAADRAACGARDRAQEGGVEVEAGADPDRLRAASRSAQGSRRVFEENDHRSRRTLLELADLETMAAACKQADEGEAGGCRIRLLTKRTPFGVQTYLERRGPDGEHELLIVPAELNNYEAALTYVESFPQGIP